MKKLLKMGLSGLVMSIVLTSCNGCGGTNKAPAEIDTGKIDTTKADVSRVKDDTTKADTIKMQESLKK